MLTTVSPRGEGGPEGVPAGVRSTSIYEYEPDGPYISTLKAASVFSTKSKACSHVGVGLKKACPLSPFLFVIFMNRISRCSSGEEPWYSAGNQWIGLSGLGVSHWHKWSLCHDFVHQ